MNESKKGYQHGNYVVKDENADLLADSYSERPWRPIGLQDVEVPTCSRQSAHRWQ
jgi:hypothetical protein